MRKLVSAGLVVVFLSVMAGSVFAEGGKVQHKHKGSKGQGSVVQNQVKVNK